MTDVNTAFADTKRQQLDMRRTVRDADIARQANKQAWIAGQVASGNMVQIAQNRFRVVSGWDAGEIFTVNRNTQGQIAEVVAEHGLDLRADGTVALYSKVPTWFGLGQIIPAGISDIDQVLDLGGIAYEVTKRQVRYSFMTEDEDTPSLRDMADRFVTVRSDTGKGLGVVGARYEVIQNRSLFTFLEELVAESGVIWESAGALRGGLRVFVSMRLPEAVHVDAEGINDEIVPFVVAINSHDGQSPAQAVVTPWRPVCANTERFAVRDAHTKWTVRHTSGALSRIEEARRTLALTHKYYENWAAEETALARTNLTITKFHAVLEDLWPSEDINASKRASTNDANRRAALTAMFEREVERVGRTAYAAERAVTDYLDHAAPVRPGKTMTEEIARSTRLLEGADDELKSKAHKKLMLLVRR